MAAKIVSEIDSFKASTHFIIGLTFLIISYLTYFLSSNFFQKYDISFISFFNYAEGLEIGSDVVIAGIDVGKVNNLELEDNGVIVYGTINNDYVIPSDSLLVIRSNGIFGKKSLLIEPGFGDNILNNNHEFLNSKDSYSVDMFLRYLSNLNE